MIAGLPKLKPLALDCFVLAVVVYVATVDGHAVRVLRGL